MTTISLKYYTDILASTSVDDDLLVQADGTRSLMRKRKVQQGEAGSIEGKR